MAIENGTASSINDLGDKLVTFATSNGWTQNGTTTTQGTGKRFHLSKGNVYLNFRTFNTETPSMNNGTSDSNSHTGSLLVSLSTGYNSGQNWYNQTGFASYSGSSATSQTCTAGIGNFTSSIPAYWFFSLSGTGYDVLYVVTEAPAGEYSYLLMGMLDKSKYGDETTPKGLFATGTISHCDTTRGKTRGFFYGAANGSWGASNTNSILNAAVATSFSGFAYTRSSAFNTTVTSSPSTRDNTQAEVPFMLNIPNSFSSTSPAKPIIVGLQETTGNYWVPIGELPSVYLTNITNYNAGDTVTIGSDNYKIFPFYKKDVSNAVEQSLYANLSSGTLAYMIKY